MLHWIQLAVRAVVIPRHPLPVLGILLSKSCTPTEVAESRFQALAQTCYEFPAAQDAGFQTAFNSGLVRPEGCEDPYGDGSGGSGGNVATGEAAAGGTGDTSGSAGSVEDAGESGPSTVRQGAADAGNAGAGGSSQTPLLSEACSALATKRDFVGASDDMAIVLALFAAPVAVGGCQNDDGEGGCHEASSSSQLDLISAGVVERLRGGLNDASDPEYECAEIEPARRTWINVGGDETTSFLWQKVNSDYFGEVLPAPPCGDSMPSEPGTVASLDTADRECILGWIRLVSAVGGLP